MGAPQHADHGQVELAVEKSLDRIRRRARVDLNVDHRMCEAVFLQKR